jgi:hypothetical protein
MSDMAPRGRRHSGVGDSEPSRSSGRATFVTGCNLLAIYIRWQGGELTHPQFEKKNKSIYWWGIVHRYITIQLTRAQRGRCSNGTCPVGTEIMFQNPPDIRQPLHLDMFSLGSVRCVCFFPMKSGCNMFKGYGRGQWLKRNRHNPKSKIKIWIQYSPNKYGQAWRAKLWTF